MLRKKYLSSAKVKEHFSDYLQNNEYITLSIKNENIYNFIDFIIKHNGHLGRFIKGCMLRLPDGENYPLDTSSIKTYQDLCTKISHLNIEIINCPNLEFLDEIPSNCKSLNLHNVGIKNLESLRGTKIETSQLYLYMRELPNFEEIGFFPPSLKVLTIRDCQNYKFSDEEERHMRKLSCVDVICHNAAYFKSAQGICTNRRYLNEDEKSWNIERMSRSFLGSLDDNAAIIGVIAAQNSSFYRL
jgi:hypothetical protein